MITLYGIPAILQVQDMARVEQVEQAFTVLDSRASRAILGTAPVQITNVELGGGTLAAVPNGTGSDSYIFVKSKTDTFNVLIPMGKIKYQLGDRTVAYEGGGVWSQYPSGGSVMISPPEFHYNGVTLTLPVMNITGSSSAGGGGYATISLSGAGAPLVEYPNILCSGCGNRVNPVNYTVTKGVYVNITSDYYDAWADYAETIGFVKVLKVNPATRTVSLELTVVPSMFGVNTTITNPIVFRGLNISGSTPLINFSFTIIDTNFNNFNWQLTATSGSKTLIYHLKKGTDLSVGYKDTAYGAETWTKTNAFTVAGNHVDVDLLDRNIKLQYNSDTVGTENNCIKIGSGEFVSPDFSWDDVITSGKYQSLYNITQHYMWLMAQPDGDISFYGCSPASKHGPEPGSTMRIYYNVTGALTYLHITRNDLGVSIS